jgi:hypothetical protein
MTPMQKREHQHQLCAKRLERSGPHLGLYCAQHSVWLRWISQKDCVNSDNTVYLVNK